MWVLRENQGTHPVSLGEAGHRSAGVQGSGPNAIAKLLGDVEQTAQDLGPAPAAGLVRRMDGGNVPLARALAKEQSSRSAAARGCHLRVWKTRRYLEITQPLREKQALWSRGMGGPGRHPTRASASSCPGGFPLKLRAADRSGQAQATLLRGRGWICSHREEASSGHAGLPDSGVWVPLWPGPQGLIRTPWALRRDLPSTPGGPLSCPSIQKPGRVQTQAGAKFGSYRATSPARWSVPRFRSKSTR